MVNPHDHRGRYGNEDKVDVDLLHGGRQAPTLRERIPTRWRARIFLVVVFAAGLVLGGYFGYVWPESGAESRREAIQLTARVTAVHGLYQAHPPYRLAVKFRNTGPLPVAVEQLRVTTSAFDVAPTPGHRSRLRPEQSETILYAITPQCGATPPGEATAVRVRVRPSTGATRFVTLNAPVSDSVRDGYAIMCGSAPVEVTIQATTLEARQATDELRFRVELAAVSAGEVPSPGSLRLLDVNLDVEGITARAPNARAGGTLSLPQTVSLALTVENCERAEAAIGEVTRLKVAMTSADGPYLRYAHTDPEFTEALRSYVTDRCGAQG